MTTLHAEQALVINARAEKLYAVVADYWVGHPAILPKPYFQELVVEKGGVGAGTVVRGSIKVMGKVFPLHHLVSEPELGRVLQESDLDKPGEFTQFRFEPVNGGAQTRVTIATEFVPSPGMMGVLERLTKPGMARKMYRQELNNLAEYISRVQNVPANERPQPSAEY
jgi:hypothetical protein